MVRIRMSRLGRPHRPFYRINAVDSRVKRDGAVIENLGWYNPMAKGEEKSLDLNIERIKHWISMGAQPSDTVRNMLAKNGVIDAAKVKAEHEKRVAAKKAAAEKKALHAASEKKDEKKA
ncbi:MAG: 30S ribosomal protein S16 [Phycisphaerales bacterium]